jgi:PAS domain S-box-containing protein
MQNRLQVLDAVLDASPFAIVAVDCSGLVLVWNHSAERILGWSAEETIGQQVPRTRSCFRVPGDPILK